MEVKLLSLNVRGLRNSDKRREVFRWLKRFHEGNNSFIYLQETHSVLKDEPIWQREWGSKIVFGHGTSLSRGVAILFPQNYDCDIISENAFCDGRKVIVCIKLNDSYYTLVNVYAPTKDNVKDQMTFVSSLRYDIENCTGNIIIGGDLNVYLNTSLDKDVYEHANIPAAKEINSILEDYDLIDIWRVKNPDKKLFTWRRRKPLVQSRLDYWIIPTELIFNVTKCKILPSIKTDHSLISLQLQNNNMIKRGPGLWKFNDSLIHDTVYVQKLKSLISKLTENQDIENKSLKWEFIKMEIRKFTIEYSKKVAKETREHEDNLNDRYHELFEKINKTGIIDEHLDVEFEAVKNELEKLNSVKAEGIKIRSRAQLIEDNEKNSKFFLNMEKRNYQIKHITKLKDGNSAADETDPGKILKSIEHFYSKLYGDNVRNDLFDDIFLRDLPQISEENYRLMEEPITLKELSGAVKVLKGGKSPGSDGFTANFYKFFWLDIQHLVKDSIDYAFKNDLLSDEQRRVNLRLIPKGGKDLLYLKNWRPISLLNTDYKILAHLLALRMQKVLPEIISPDQNAYLKGRFIGINIRTIIDSIEYSSQNQINTILAFLDFEKAFDKLNWDFIEKCLDGFGFGPVLRKWIKIMYTDISSAAINNGFTTHSFKLKCGIRQGCPMSALIFILAAETLSLSIKKNKNINGLLINNFEVKITQLADDTTLILQDINSLRTALNILHLFHKASGLKLNYTKTEILQLGESNYSKTNPYNLKWVKDRVYALGTWFYKDMKKIIEVNHEVRFEIFESVLKHWKMRKLTLLGKLTVLKSLAMSKLNYCIATLETPEWFTRQVQNAINVFIWGESAPRIKYTSAIAEYNDGGIRLPDIHNYILAQKAVWVKRLSNSTSLHFSEYLCEFLPVMNFKDILNLSIDPDVLSKNIPLFYKQVLYAWYMINDNVESLHDILYQILWLNRHIQIDNDCMVNDEWYKRGCVFVKDLLSEDGTFLSCEAFIEKFSVKCNFLTYMSIIDAIPKQWKEIIKLDRGSVCEEQASSEIERKFGSSIKVLTKIESKDIYWKLTKAHATKPSCIKNWAEKYNFVFEECEWKKIFQLVFDLTKDVKVREFQLKLIHRFYASNSYVSHFDNAVSSLCSICNVKCDICHMFYSCSYVKPFWLDFMNWFIRNFYIIVIRMEDVIFGKIQPKSFILNYCILYGKWFLHKQYKNCENNPIKPSLNNYLSFLRNNVQLEKYISNKNHVMETYVKTFHNLEMVLSIGVNK